SLHDALPICQSIAVAPSRYAPCPAPESVVHQRRRASRHPNAVPRADDIESSRVLPPPPSGFPLGDTRYWPKPGGRIPTPRCKPFRVTPCWCLVPPWLHVGAIRGLDHGIGHLA